MAAESDVVRIAREFREQLAQNEDNALREMSRHWVRMEKTLEDRYLLLYQEIQARMKNGQPVPEQMIWNIDRWHDMINQIREEIPEYNDEALEIIDYYQRENFNLGLDAANAMIKKSEPSSVSWTRVYKEAVENMAGITADGTPLSRLLDPDYGQMTSAIMNTLVDGIGLGKGPYQVAQEISRDVGMHFNRSARIARTEIARAHRLAETQQFRASGVVVQVFRLADPSTACAACLAMDGEECEDFYCDDHPNGCCTTVVKTRHGVLPKWKKGSEWFEEQDEDRKKAILGEGHYELYQQGVPLRDMVTMKQDNVWGASPQVIPVKELISSRG